MKFPFINIHTHKPCAEHALCISNLFTDDFYKGNKKISGFFSVGIHPWYIKDEKTLEKQLSLLKEIVSHSNCLAIGEAGLDKLTETDWDLQYKAFIEQIRISEKSGKPMIIHCVKAWDEILKLRKQSKTTFPWIIHGFNSSEQMARQLLDAGCFLSFGKMIMKPDSKAAKVLKYLKPDEFFLETDDEDITIGEIYNKTAELRNISIDELKKQLSGNFERLFKIFSTDNTL
ncbi:MAG: TatD family deoxyribonuclease [Bacteroidetes bacterium]|nr:MAG: TatD family deoxyribonuclease [Bacteroidota bacterium]